MIAVSKCEGKGGMPVGEPPDRKEIATQRHGMRIISAFS